MSNNKERIIKQINIMKMQIHFKRSKSLQDYLDELNKEEESEYSKDEWGFFVDIEINVCKEKIKIIEYKHNKNQNQNQNQMEIIKETHHYHHYYNNENKNDNNENDNENDNENKNEAENTLINYGNTLMVVGFLLYIILF